MACADDHGPGSRHSVSGSGLADRLLRHPVACVFLVALIARICLAVAINHRFGGFLFSDERMYTRIAQQAASGNTSSWDDYTRWLYDFNGTFMRPLALVYRIAGPRVIAGQLAVALVGAIVAAITARVALEALRPGYALFAGLVVALLPSQVLWSSVTLKDSLVWLALVTVALLFSIAARSSAALSAICFSGIAIVLLLLAYLRQHTMLMTCVALVLASWVGHPRLRRSRMITTAAILLLLPFTLGLGISGSGLVSSRAGTLDHQRALNAADASTALVAPTGPSLDATAARAAANARRAAEAAKAAAAAALPGDAAAQQRVRELERKAARAASAATAAATARTTADNVLGDESVTAKVQSSALYLPSGIATMLARPYPWQTAKTGSLRMAKLEMLVWYPLLMLAVVGLSTLRKTSRALFFPLVAGAGSAIMWALVEGNFGTAYRHRGEFVWVVALLAAAGLSVLRGRRPSVRHEEQKPQQRMTARAGQRRT
jgi:hypothetical protein